ncbi:hypothetical protein QTP88_019093 [Uroleucon formosanum]
MSNSDSSVESEKKRKKGVSNFESYKANIIKKAKIKGLPHTNHVGKELTERRSGLPCNTE